LSPVVSDDLYIIQYVFAFVNRKMKKIYTNLGMLISEGMVSEELLSLKVPGYVFRLICLVGMWYNAFTKIWRMQICIEFSELRKMSNI